MNRGVKGRNIPTLSTKVNEIPKQAEQSEIALKPDLYSRADFLWTLSSSVTISFFPIFSMLNPSSIQDFPVTEIPGQGLTKLPACNVWTSDTHSIDTCPVSP